MALNRRTALKPKRDRPRRNEGRIQHDRIKEKIGRPPTTEERRHIARVAALPCLVSGKRPVTVHHVTASIHGGRMPRSHKRVVPLAPEYHLIQFGPKESVEALGHAGFYRAHGIDLLAEAERLWQESQDEQGASLAGE